MVAPSVLVDARGAAEFRGEHDERVIEEPAALEVGEQAGEALVEILATLRHADEVPLGVARLSPGDRVGSLGLL